MIKIGINKELDYEIYLDFHNFSVEGADFGGKIKKDHPNINIKNYKEYIDNFYIKNNSVLLKKQDEINSFVDNKQNIFFIVSKNLFGLDLSKNIYQGYISIFNCNPRYLDNMTFQIYYKKDLLDMLEVAFHESLHFAFFEYIDIKFSDKIKGLDKNSGKLWELSEIFNVIVLNLRQFRKIIEREERLFYPNLKEKLDEAKILWNSSKNIYDFINKYLS